MDTVSGPRRTFNETGVPLLDAIVTALIAAYEEGRADEAGDPIARVAAYQVSLTTIAEVQRLWKQLDIEVNAGRNRKAPGHRAEGRDRMRGMVDGTG